MVRKMFNRVIKKTVGLSLVVSIGLTVLAGCKSAPSGGTGFRLEDSAFTGYGAAAKGTLTIEDFFFLSKGTSREVVSNAIGTESYLQNNESSQAVYELASGDHIVLEYDKDERISGAVYGYSNGDDEDFLQMLVELGILRSTNTVDISSGSNGGQSTTPSDNTDSPSDNSPTDDQPDDETEINIKNPSDTTGSTPVVQTGYFASGSYDKALFDNALSIGMSRNTVLDNIGKPNFYYSSNFKNDSYIVDCYVLSDGSTLYLDYGYSREYLRCARTEKSGIYTVYLGTWSVQSKPGGFTRDLISQTMIDALRKDMVPSTVYSLLGEPHWYQGSSARYRDAYELIDGTIAYLDFGSAHNKLTTITLIDISGKETLISL